MFQSYSPSATISCRLLTPINTLPLPSWPPLTFMSVSMQGTVSFIRVIYRVLVWELVYRNICTLPTATPLKKIVSSTNHLPHLSIKSFAWKFLSTMREISCFIIPLPYFLKASVNIAVFPASSCPSEAIEHPSREDTWT